MTDDTDNVTDNVTDNPQYTVTNKGTNAIMNETEYKELIAEIIRKLQREKCVRPEFTQEGGKLRVNIQLHEPTWYTEYDDLTKNDVFENLILFMTEKVESMGSISKS